MLSSIPDHGTTFATKNINIPVLGVINNCSSNTHLHLSTPPTTCYQLRSSRPGKLEVLTPVIHFGLHDRPCFLCKKAPSSFSQTWMLLLPVLICSGFTARSVSEDSLRRYVTYASERCIQELLSASESSRAGGGDGWKVLAFQNGVEISKRSAGSLHVFRSSWLLRSVSPQQFIVVATAIDAAKVSSNTLLCSVVDKHREASALEVLQGFDESGKLSSHAAKLFLVVDDTQVVAVASLPKQIAAGLQPKNNKAIRGLLLQSGWVVEKLEDDSCMCAYLLFLLSCSCQLDPAGWLPKCFVNRLNTKLVMIIENLKKLAETCPLEKEI
ncbi:hypothetical protein GW17_00008632 [Ensete ventricosum]|nr:hypothetical protein GW17_00008632 [Ensete ventricosum]RZS22320.1 hypothetical protein BHM03_00055072 [Ensete ventricosum]